MQLKLIAGADQALDAARRAAAEQRAGVGAAEQERAALGGDEQQAWAALRRSRDRVVGLGAPAVEGADLAGAWDALAAWAGVPARRAGQAAARAGRGAPATLSQQLASDGRALTRLLAEHGITRRHRPRAGSRRRWPGAGRTPRRNSKPCARPASRRPGWTGRSPRPARRSRSRRARPAAPGHAFERWLCSEALDSLVAEASVTLRELSGGQYELDRDERNELVVIDYEDAGARRPVHTLSGGETFQASLALALALSRQVVELSAGMRDLNSMFLDEGFGTLDEDTLETVASTLERLAEDSGRMVGIVTHVAALAERVPVRFVVSRTGTSSALREERT